MTIRQAKILKDTHFRIIHTLQENPDPTLPELLENLGMDGLYYCFKALIDKGLVKIQDSLNINLNRKYLYLLTLQGFSINVELTSYFLRCKIVEYDALKLGIQVFEPEALKKEGLRKVSR
jgi:hypothetical protein